MTDYDPLRLCECDHQQGYHTKKVELIPGKPFNGCTCIGCGCPAFSARRDGIKYEGQGPHIGEEE